MIDEPNTQLHIQGWAILDRYPPYWIHSQSDWVSLNTKQKHTNKSERFFPSHSRYPGSALYIDDKKNLTDTCPPYKENSPAQVTVCKYMF